jgi:hypothetical protein
MKVTIGTIVVFGFLYLVLWHLPVNGWHLQTSKGEQTGFVTAVETNGVFFKTPRVYIKSELSSSQEEAFCVAADQATITRLEEAARTQERLTLEFVDWFMRGAKYCGGVEEIGVVKSIK